MPINSVSKTMRSPLSASVPFPQPAVGDSLNVDPAGMAAPIARSPYANAGGIVSFLLSPMHISRRPSSHLLIQTALASGFRYNEHCLLPGAIHILPSSVLPSFQHFLPAHSPPHRSSPPSLTCPRPNPLEKENPAYPLITMPFPTVKLNGCPRS